MASPYIIKNKKGLSYRLLKFCKTCGSLMVPTKTDSGVLLVCKKCETTEAADKDIKLKTMIKNKDRQKTVVVSDRTNAEGTEVKECPDCHENRMVIQWQVQTRSADEAPTTFYKCTYCSHTWRDYGG